MLRKKKEKNRKYVLKSLLHLISFQCRYVHRARYNFSNTYNTEKSFMILERKKIWKTIKERTQLPESYGCKINPLN